MYMTNLSQQSPTQAWSSGCLIDLYMDAAEAQGYDSANSGGNGEDAPKGTAMGLNIPEVMEKVIEKTKKVVL